MTYIAVKRLHTGPAAPLGHQCGRETAATGVEWLSLRREQYGPSRQTRCTRRRNASWSRWRAQAAEDDHRM